MPPEPTKAKFKRKLGRREVEEYKFDGGHAREIEQKRNSGQISCAECRRLKIKCDKQIPCQSCQRRGCAALCPNGSLSTGQGTRFVLAATEHLHRRIAKMSERIRELEDALGDLQAQHSTEPHPLLREDLLGANHLKDEDSKEETPQDESSAAGHPPELLDAFGTLSITDHGISRFFGPTGGSECLLMQDGPGSSPPDSARDPGPSQLLQDLRLFSQAFPFTPVGPTSSVRELIVTYLPNWERASYLSQTYTDQAGWLFHCVSKDQIDNELLPLYYSNAPLKATEGKSVHDLALLFLVFAVGALVDVVQKASNVEAEHYHQIARAAICLQPVLEKPSLATIQALHMLSMYNAMSGNELSGEETSMETTWSLIVLAAHLSHTIGLHRDSAKWGLDEEIVRRRRIMFWDLFVADAWESLNTGRPPCFSLAYIDCRYPGSENGSDQMDVETVMFESWNYRFATECVAEVAARTLTAEIPSYATIMELDRKVREFPIPEDVENVATSLISPIPTNPLEGLSPPDSKGCFVMVNAREVILLYIHRCFFAQAIIENPVNPLKSQYAPSFLATYRASSIILRTIGAHYSNSPQLCARFWSVWTFAFSAAIVFGTIVTRGPRSPLASNAIKELDEACVLFTKAACYSRRAAKALPILKKLSEKAHNVLVAAQNEKSSSSSPCSSSTSQLGQQWSVKEVADADELAIFAGRTRFVSTRRLAAESKQTQAPAPPEGGRSSGSVSSLRGAGVPESTTAPPPPPPTSLYGADGAISSSVERWAVATDREQMQQQYSVQHAPAVHPPLPSQSAVEYVDVGLELEPQPQQQMPQWRPPRRSHYTYTPQHQHEHYATDGGPRLSSGSLPQPQPQSVSLGPAPTPTSHHQPQHTRTHSGHEHGMSITTPSHQWTSSSSGMSNHFEDAGGYGTSASGSGYPGHHNVHAHTHAHSHSRLHAYESLHANTYQPPSHPSLSSVQAPPSVPTTSIQASTLAPAPPPLLPSLQSLPPSLSAPALSPQHHAPSELTDLGLVAQVSRLDERWTSFMHDSGYFEGFGYRGR